MSETHSNPLDDPNANPFEVAADAAADIARLTGVEKHDIALTLGTVSYTHLTLPTSDLV